MAKSRAQRKAEAAKRRAARQDGADAAERDAESRAQHDTQVPESADVLEAEIAIEQGADQADRIDGEIDGSATSLEAPAPARVSRREQRRQTREEAKRVKEQAERRAPREPTAEKERGAVMGFLASVVAELRKVQWPDRDTLVQASAVTILFVAVAAAYLGALDAVFSRLVDLII